MRQPNSRHNNAESSFGRSNRFCTQLLYVGFITYEMDIPIEFRCVFHINRNREFSFG